MIKKYVDWLVDHPVRVIVISLIVTLFFASQFHRLFMVLDPKRILPQDHPYVKLNNQIEQAFGGSRVVVIGVSVRNGTIFNPETLGKIKRITEEVKKIPGILEENVVSISDRKIKLISSSPTGMDIRPVMETIPKTPEGLEALKKDLFSNDLYVKSLVSEDGKSAAIITDFRSGVLSPAKASGSSGSGKAGSGGNPWWNPNSGGSGGTKGANPGSAAPAAGQGGSGGTPWWNGEKGGKGSATGGGGGTTWETLAWLLKSLIFGSAGQWPMTGDNPYWTSDSTIYKKIHLVIDREKDANTEIDLGGLPIALSFLEADTNIMNEVVFPVAFLVIMGVLFLSFRSFQGMVIPIMTAGMSVVWALGLLGLLGIPLDPFTKTLTPLLIVAIAAGHSIQILKRFYEEYGSTGNHKEAVRRSTLRMAPVMLTAGLVASASFASLITFHLKTFQAFGLLTAFGIVSAVVLELSFIPAVRVVIKPGAPPNAEKNLSGIDSLLSSLGGFVQTGRKTIIAVGVAFIILSTAGASMVHVNNSLKSQFFEKTELRQSDRAINAAFGGTSTFYILIDGNAPDRLKDPAVMTGIEGLQKKLETVAGVGKTQSYVDYLKKMNRSLHAGDPAWEKIPENRQAAAEYLLLYTMSGNPADFNRLVDYNYQKAVVWVFLKSDSTALAEQLIGVVNDFKKGNFPPDILVGVAGSSPVTVALNETMVEGKKYNILQISALTFVISSLVFRSLLGGLLVMIPLLLSVLINFGFMGFSGLSLGIGTATISAMSVGIGADYAIYFLFRLREEYEKSGDSEKAFRVTMTTAGKSILFVALAISAGCATLIFPGYYLHTEGILVPLAMLTSSVGAITLLPALTAWFRPKFVFGGK